MSTFLIVVVLLLILGGGFLLKLLGLAVNLILGIGAAVLVVFVVVEHCHRPFPGWRLPPPGESLSTDTSARCCSC